MDDVEHIPNVRVPRQFEAFYRQEYAVVLALTYVLSGSRPAAEDLTQEAFLRATGTGIQSVVWRHRRRGIVGWR